MTSAAKGRSSPTRRRLSLVAGLLLAVGWAVWLRPTTLGGQQTYIVVEGSSMEPTYQDGDFVLVREEKAYAIGDIIAFRVGGVFDDPTRVIHRIVGEADDGAFITQGDNRPVTDPWAPMPEDIIGTSIAHVPHAGDVATTLGRPQVLAALGGAAVIMGGKRRRRRPRAIAAPEAEPIPSTDRPLPLPPRGRRASSRWMRHTEPRWAFIGLVVSVVVGLPTLAGLWSAVQASTTAVRIDQIGGIDHGIAADYRFIGAVSAVYPTGEVGTTETVAGVRTPSATLYSKLIQRLEIAVDFTATADGADAFTSEYAIDVVVSMPEGWSRTLSTVAPTPFEGAATQVAVVDLAAVALQIQQVAELTGVGGQEYTVTVTPRLTVEASGGGAEASDTLAPPLTFLVRSGVIEAPPLTDTSATSPLSRQTTEASRFSLGLFSVETLTARGLLAGLALVMLAATAWFASVLFGGVGLTEADQIAARYRAQLVDVSSATAPPGPVVLVGSIGELARLAKVDQSVILHEELGDGSHRYRVFLGAVTYQYETAPEHGGAAHADPVEGTDRPVT